MNNFADSAHVEVPRFAPLWELTFARQDEAYTDANLLLMAEMSVEDVPAWIRLRKHLATVGWGKRDVDELIRAVGKRRDQHLERFEERKADEARQRREQAAQAGDLRLLDPSAPMAVAEAFVRDVRPHVLWTNSSWMDFDHNRYVEVEDKHIRQDLYAFLKGAVDAEKGTELKPNKQLVDSVYDALQAMEFKARRTYAPPAWLTEPEDWWDEPDPAREFIALNNGLLHVPTQDLRPLTADFFTHNGLPFDYVAPSPNAQPSRWLTFLGQLWPQDTEAHISLLQEAMGYVLTHDISQHKIFMLIGPPRSGKSTIGRVLTALLGDGNWTSPTLPSLAGNFGLEPLIGKQLMLVADLRVGSGSVAELTGRLLSISGNDPLSVPRKYREAWEGTLPCRIWFISNLPLLLPDMSGALNDRIIPLVIEQSFLGREDTHLMDKLLPELPLILNWALDGYRRLVKRGHFVLPTRSVEMHDYVAAMSAPVGTFVKQCCVVEEGAEIHTTELLRAYNAWEHSMDVNKPMDGSQFGRALTTATGYRVQNRRPSKDGPYDEKAGRKRQVPVYSGIRLREDCQGLLQIRPDEFDAA